MNLRRRKHTRDQLPFKDRCVVVLKAAPSPGKSAPWVQGFLIMSTVYGSESGTAEDENSFFLKGDGPDGESSCVPVISVDTDARP